MKARGPMGRFLNRLGKGSIRYSVFISFTVSAFAAIVLSGLTFYARFSSQLQSNVRSENRQLVEQVNQSLNSYLRSMIRLSDSISYGVIKNTDLEASSIDDKLQLLYDNNTNLVENIVLFDAAGNVLATAPPATLKKGVDVTRQEWFRRALAQTENLHFSTPMVQNMFASSEGSYSYVVSLSCAVELTYGMRTDQGVLLITLKYGAISELFSNTSLINDGYIYLTGSDGTILYHPKQQLIATGRYLEDSASAAALSDGTHTVETGARPSTLIVRSAGYTGWKVVGVIPQVGLTLDTARDFLFLAMIFLAYFAALVLINALISTRLTRPIQQLENSVRRLERGEGEAIYIGGSYEVQHLGRSVQQMVDQMRKLTLDIVREHEEKQRHELDALQAQINPHFLYNTLDIIVWMIERNKPEEAVRIVTALARLFRISLSKGRNFIPVRDELEHTRNYLTIQQMRYKDKFTYSIDAPEETLELAVIKLVVQPIVENAIYHSMDFMDGEGEIRVTVRVEGSDLFISVSDNGIGMPQDLVDRLLVEHFPISKGSGVGLKNVNERIRLYAGDAYGVIIESELDVGTTITLRLPALPYSKEEAK
ncbi:MAG TPA: sensor histidine kinase [Clostridia bacterium]|nr:sensor histidine kinase [Clostridia bacterium]HPK14445.1 sensor histidine kinase [Clostridia bacterium]